MNNYDDLLTGARAEAQAPQFSKEDWIAKKKAERDEVYALSDAIAIEVAGDGSKFREFLDVQARLDRYSAVNALLVFAQKPESARLGDFEHWKSLGGYVKPGQAAISILEPHEYTKDDGALGVGYNVKKVFDISQVDARKMKADLAPPTYSDRQLLAALVHNAPMEIASVDSLPGNANTETDMADGKVMVRRGMEFAEIFRSIAQALADAYLSECPQGLVNDGFSAYCASYLLCKKYGVDASRFTFDESPKAFGGLDAQEVKASLAQIRDAAGETALRMSRQLEAASRAAKNQGAR